MGGTPDEGARDELRIVRYPGLALLTLDGPDASAFLEAQSMTALARLGAGQVRLCAFADARGRVLITACAWISSAGWRLVVARTEAAWFAAHLHRYRFRARVDIAVSDLAIAGLLGHHQSPALPAWPTSGRMLRSDDGLEIVSLRGDRRLLVAASAVLEDALAGLRRAGARAADSESWTRARLVAGEPEIRAATRAKFLPQMIALDALGAVDLHKGCYPGQEVIARTHHLGRVKRGMVLLRAETPARAGDVFDLEGERLELLDRAAAPDGSSLLQAVAPIPLPPALAAFRVSSLGP